MNMITFIQTTWPLIFYGSGPADEMVRDYTSGLSTCMLENLEFTVHPQKTVATTPNQEIVFGNGSRLTSNGTVPARPEYKENKSSDYKDQGSTSPEYSLCSVTPAGKAEFSPLFWRIVQRGLAGVEEEGNSQFYTAPCPISSAAKEVWWVN